MDEVRLAGGNVSGATRVGTTVRRRTGAWTPAVHEFLNHLAARGVPGVPKVHGVDESGREILDYLPGTVIDVDTETLTDRQLAHAARWLRTFHDAAADFPARHRRWYFLEQDPATGPSTICHNDIAPYNMCFEGDSLVGVFDWDLCGPGDPRQDLAFLAYNGVPLTRAVPGRHAGDDRRRLAILLRHYDPAGHLGWTEHELAQAALTRMESAAGKIAAGQRAGDAGMLALARIGEPAATLARIAAARPRVAALAGDDDAGVGVKDPASR